MAAVVSSRGRTELQIPQKWKDTDEANPGKTKLWVEPNKPKLQSSVVPVVYYLCSRHGQLEHPHFMEVPLSSSEGLFLRDVINRLNFLRGKGMATMYSWSCKRSYKNGFVWHDLAESDFIYPAHGQEYILKGSELLESPSPPLNPNKSHETASSSSPTPATPPPEIHRSGEISRFPAISRHRRRNQSWCSSEFNEYRVYKADTSGELAGKGAADAATQTDDERRRWRMIREEEEKETAATANRTELSGDEISPPPSDSSPETLESLIKADGKLLRRSLESRDDELRRVNPTAKNSLSGRIRPSTVLMQLMACGSMSFRNCGVSSTATAVEEENHRLASPLPGNDNETKSGTTRGKNQVGSLLTWKARGIGGGVKLEDKEYFSGSLIETKKDETFSALKRSSSCNADRASRLELEGREIDGVQARCIPRMPKTPLVCKKEDSGDGTTCSQGGSRKSLGPKESNGRNAL